MTTTSIERDAPYTYEHFIAPANHDTEQEMTTEVFLQKFREVAPRLFWYQYPDGQLRASQRKIRAKIALRIHILQKFLLSENNEDCPITAVARFTANTDYCFQEYRSAADKLGLPAALAIRIAQAADENTPGDEFRKQLLQIAGL